MVKIITQAYLEKQLKNLTAKVGADSAKKIIATNTLRFILLPSKKSTANYRYLYF